MLTSINNFVGTAAILHGLGNHMEVIVEANAVKPLLKLTYACFTTFDIALPFGKVAVSALLLAVLGHADTIRRWILIFVAVSNVLIAIPQIFLLWFFCNPPSAAFDPLQQDKCNIVPNQRYTYFQGGMSVFLTPPSSVETFGGMSCFSNISRQLCALG